MPTNFSEFQAALVASASPAGSLLEAQMVNSAMKRVNLSTRVVVVLTEKAVDSIKLDSIALPDSEDVRLKRLLME